MRKRWLTLTLFVAACAVAAVSTRLVRAQKPGPPPESDDWKYHPPGATKSVEIGNFYFRRKKYRAALSRYKEAITEDSTYAPGYLGLGRVYEKIGLKQKALDAYRKYLDALPSEKDAEDAKEVHRAIERLEKETGSRAPKSRSAPTQATAEPQ